MLFPDHGRAKPHPSHQQGGEPSFGLMMMPGGGCSGLRGRGASWCSLPSAGLCPPAWSCAVVTAVPPPGTPQPPCSGWKRSGLSGSLAFVQQSPCTSLTGLFSLSLQPLERRGAGSCVLLAPGGSGGRGDCSGRVHAVPRASQEQVRVALHPVLPVTPASPSRMTPR